MLRYPGVFSSLPAADLPSGCSRSCDFEKTWFVIFGVEIHAMANLGEERATKIILGNPVAKVGHRVRFAPVFAIFPDLNWRAANLLSEFQQSRVVCISAVAQKDLVVLRDQLSLQLVN